jgi:hypothetical protein
VAKGKAGVIFQTLSSWLGVGGIEKESFGFLLGQESGKMVLGFIVFINVA